MEKLQRDITGMGTGLIAINGVIGAGVFVLPALVAAKMGTFSPWMFLIGALLILPIVLSIGEVASHFEITGGPVAYVRQAFGPEWSFQVGWLGTLAAMAALAANTNALLLNAGAVVGIPEQGPFRVGAIGLFWAFLAGINIVGVRQGMRLLSFLTVLKLAPLLLLLVLGLGHLSPASLLNSPTLPDLSTWRQSLLLVIYAYVGFEGTFTTAGETRNPKRNIPRAVILSILGAAVFYFLLQLVCITLDPQLGLAKAPLARIAGVLVGPLGATVMTLAAVFSISGNLSAAIISVPRNLYFMGRAGDLPSWLGLVHDRYRTPWISISLFSAAVFLLASTGSFAFLATMAALAKLLSYSASVLASPRICGRTRLSAVNLLALGVCVLLVAQAELKSWLTLGSLMAVGGLLRWGAGRSLHRR